MRLDAGGSQGPVAGGNASFQCSQIRPFRGRATNDRDDLKAALTGNGQTLCMRMKEGDKYNHISRVSLPARGF